MAVRHIAALPTLCAPASPILSTVLLLVAAHAPARPMPWLTSVSSLASLAVVPAVAVNTSASCHSALFCQAAGSRAHLSLTWAIAYHLGAPLVVEEIALIVHLDTML